MREHRGAGQNPQGTWPPVHPGVAGPGPLYGMWVMSESREGLQQFHRQMAGHSQAARGVVHALDLALATSSGTVWTPTPGWQTKVCPNWVSMATGIRSSGLKPSDL